MLGSSKLLEPAANQEAHCLACSYFFLDFPTRVAFALHR
jgi:hypothetical protein